MSTRSGPQVPASRSFARALGIDIPEPYPLSFPRMIDLFPLQSLQATIDPKQEIFLFGGHVSVPIKSEINDKSVTQNKDHTLTIVQNPMAGIRTAVKFGDQTGTVLSTQEEIWEEVQDLMGFDELTGPIVPELAVRLRGLRNPVPYDVCDHPDLAGMEQIYQIQTSRGNRTKSYRERLGLELTNYKHIQRNDLSERDMWKNEFGKRLRSILRTETILAGGDRGQVGWTEVFKMPFDLIRAGRPVPEFPPLAGSLNRSLSAKKWNWDYGIPLTGEIPIVGPSRAVVYTLAKRGVVVAI